MHLCRLLYRNYQWQFSPSLVELGFSKKEKKKKKRMCILVTFVKVKWKAREISFSLARHAKERM